MKTIRTKAAFLKPFPADANQVWEGVPDEVAAHIVALGNGEIVKDEGEDVRFETSDDTIKRLAEEYAPVLEAGPEPREPEESAIPSPAAEDDGPLKRPYGNATKAAWVRYAVSVDPDLTEAAASEMSKVQLMTTYGERL